MKTCLRKWSRIGSARPRPRLALRHPRDKVILVGGFNFNDKDSSATSELYDPAQAVARAYAITDEQKPIGVQFGVGSEIFVVVIKAKFRPGVLLNAS